MDAERIKKDFPIFSKKFNGRAITYLDNAATTQKPKQAIEAEKEFYETWNSNVHRGMNFLSQRATEIYEEAHEKTAKFIGANGVEEIVFTKNATESINLLAYSLEGKIKEGDEILLTKMEHHANIVPWQQLAKRKKAKLVYAGITKELTLDMNDLERKMGKRTKIVAFTIASNILGTINPAKEICALANEKGAITIADAAQGIPHMKINAKEVGCDFMAFSGHKMLGPMGIGVLYGRQGLLREMPPFLTGGDMISTVTLEKSEWNNLPWKFEAGTPNVGGASGFSAAIDYLSKIGMEEIEEHEKKLLNHSLKRLGEIKGLKMYSAAGNKTGIIPFNLNGVHPHDIATILDSRAVAIRAGNHCAQPLLGELGIESVARASPYIYNSTKDIDELASGIEEAKRTFGV